MKPLTRDEIRSRRPATGWLLTAAIALFFGVLLLFVWQKITLSDQLVRIERKQRLLREVQSQQKALAIELQQLCYPGRLEAIARTELGMRYPDKEQMVVMISPPAGGNRQHLFAALFRPVSAAWSQQ